MIWALFVTILIEGIVVAAYSLLRRKPTGLLLLASVVINMVTQIILWIVLGIFFQYYVTALFTAEIFIWLVESVLLRWLSNGHMNLKSAIKLSFCMNAASFGAGWFLPI